jgi:hypothetical protein
MHSHAIKKTIKKKMINVKSEKLASWFGCSRHCIHCTGRHRSRNTSECGGGGDRIEYLVPEWN